jgi:hypothetical protein
VIQGWLNLISSTNYGWFDASLSTPQLLNVAQQYSLLLVIAWCLSSLTSQRGRWKAAPPSPPTVKAEYVSEGMHQGRLLRQEIGLTK